MELYVEDLDRLGEVPRTVDALVAQVEEVVDYAREHVCRAAPFEPSPLCVLRPLAAVMREAADVFGDVGERWSREWLDLRAGVVAAHGELVEAETRTRLRHDSLLRELGGVA